MQRKRKPISKNACEGCRKAHAGCSENRPCNRCVTMKVECLDVPGKKRGRKKKFVQQENEKCPRGISASAAESNRLENYSSEDLVSSSRPEDDKMPTALLPNIQDSQHFVAKNFSQELNPTTQRALGQSIDSIPLRQGVLCQLEPSQYIDHKGMHLFNPHPHPHPHSSHDQHQNYFQMKQILQHRGIPINNVNNNNQGHHHRYSQSQMYSENENDSSVEGEHCNEQQFYSQSYASPLRKKRRANPYETPPSFSPSNFHKWLQSCKTSISSFGNRDEIPDNNTPSSPSSYLSKKIVQGVKETFCNKSNNFKSISTDNHLTDQSYSSSNFLSEELIKQELLFGVALDTLWNDSETGRSSHSGSYYLYRGVTYNKSEFQHFWNQLDEFVLAKVINEKKNGLKLLQISSPYTHNAKYCLEHPHCVKLFLHDMFSKHWIEIMRNQRTKRKRISIPSLLNNMNDSWNDDQESDPFLCFRIANKSLIESKQLQSFQPQPLTSSLPTSPLSSHSTSHSNNAPSQCYHHKTGREQEIGENCQELFEIFDHSHFGIILFLLDNNHILFCNSKAKQLLKPKEQNTDALRKKSWLDLLDESQFHDIEQMIASLHIQPYRSGFSTRASYMFKRGTEKPLPLTATTTIFTQKRYGILQIFFTEDCGSPTN